MKEKTSDEMFEELGYERTLTPGEIKGSDYDIDM